MATSLQTLIDRHGATCRRGHAREKYAFVTGRGKWCCRECERIKTRTYRANMPPGKRVEQRRRYDLKANYGLSIAEWQLMYEEQRGLCGICGRDKCSSGRNFSVDHHHESGRVRGLLCYRCNALVGTIENNPDVVRKAELWIKER